MTPLARIMRARLAEGGPITVAEYMRDCLLHPQHGYYATRDPFGVAGDFTTAPEISQMFGEVLGLALAQAWLDQGAPARFALAEPGPGRGTLMADVWRATRGVPGFHAAAEVVLVEASPVLRSVQAQTLARHGVTGPRWLSSLHDLPALPLFLIANEFFDALPVHQHQFADGMWHERLIGLRDGALAFGLAEQGAPALDTPAHVQHEPGLIVEEPRQGRDLMRPVAQRVARHGGLALIVDYGGWRSRGDTLQALRAHAPDDVLAHPGEADLTAHVDFESLAQSAGQGGVALAFAPQGQVLLRLGLQARADRLATRLTGDALQSHLAATRRLTHPQEMGTLFKVLALFPPGAPLPPGFDPDDARNA